MPINIVDNQAISQMSQGMQDVGINSALQQITKPGDVKQTQEPVKVSKEELLTKIIEAKEATFKISLNMLKDFLSKASGVGVTLDAKALSGKVEGKLAKELDELLGKKEENFEDFIEISAKGADRAATQNKIKMIGRSGLGGEQQGENAEGEEKGVPLKEYLGVYSQYMATNDPRLKRKLEQIEQRLETQEKLSSEDLHSLNVNIKQSVRAEIASQIKEKLMMRFLTSPKNKIEFITHTRAADDLINEFFGNSKLSFVGKQDKEAIGAFIKETNEQAKEEIRRFLPEELENVLIKNTIKQETDMTEALEIVNLCTKSGINVKEWIDNVWLKRKEDMGLFIFTPPQGNLGASVNTSTDNPQSKNKQEFELNVDDEKDVLLGKLRALYMHMAFRPNALDRLDTFFKIRKTKNGLYRLGIFTKDMDEQVKHEGKVVAKMKTMEMLNEGLLEMATLYDLSGPAFNLISQKIKGCVSNLERLNMPISESEFTQLRDSADRRMYEVAGREIETLEGILAHSPSKQVSKKVKLLKKLQARLSKEAGIENVESSSSYSKTAGLEVRESA